MLISVALQTGRRDSSRRRRFSSFIKVSSVLKSSKMSKEWSNGLCSCLNDIPLCLTGYCAPCYVFGKNAEAVGDDCLMCGIVTFVPLANLWFATQIRGKIREQKGIDGSFVNDLLMSCCCPLCALIQEAQEVGVKAPFGNSIARS